MAAVTVTYATPSALTITLASLATSSTLVAGRESNEIDNTTNKYVDALLQGKITTGTTPTTDKLIAVYVWGSDTSAATTARDVIDGADSVETITSDKIRDGFLRLAATMAVDATSDRTYEFGPVSVANLFGGVMPRYWGVFVTHATGVNLNSTGSNHAIQFTGIKYDVT